MDSRVRAAEPKPAERARAAKPAPSLTAGPLKQLSTAAGNAAVARLVQRKELAKAPNGKTWMSTGNFDAKHLIAGTLDADTAKARYNERYNKRPVPAGRQANTVVSETDINAAIADAAKVAGAYPGRTDRKKLTVSVPGIKVTGTKAGAAQVASATTNVASMTVEGSGSDSLFYPDHVVG
jgi:hypothetical protein